MSKTKDNNTRSGLYAKDRDFLLPDYMHCETIAFRSETHDWVIDVHRNAHLFQVFLIESGDTKLMYSNKTIELNEPCIVTMPENTQHGFEFSPQIEGKVLTLSQSFIETLFENAPNVLLELKTPRILRGVAEHRRFQTIGRIVHRLYEELREELPEKKLALQCYFSLLIAEIYRLSLEKSDKAIIYDNRNAKHYQTFLQKVKQTYSPQKTIQEYARELKITPIHLNRICQTITGQSALQVIHNFFVLEAEKLLTYTEYSVSEISYKLNFNDPAYFSRLFKKQTNMSPKVFRHQFKQ